MYAVTKRRHRSTNLAAVERSALRLDQISVCSEISRASSTSMPRWFAASSASRSPQGQAQDPRPNPREFERTAESPGVASRGCDSGTQSLRTSDLLPWSTSAQRRGCGCRCHAARSSRSGLVPAFSCTRMRNGCLCARMRPSPPSERTPSGMLRMSAVAAHVKRQASPCRLIRRSTTVIDWLIATPTTGHRSIRRFAHVFSPHCRAALRCVPHSMWAAAPARPSQPSWLTADT